MAIVRAVKSGNWSDVTVWNTGALPTSADDVYSNTFTVTIDVSPTVLSISNAAATGVTAGGFFVPTNGITLTCTATNGINGGTSATACFISSLASGQSCNIVANMASSPPVTVSAPIIRNTSAGTVNFTGSVFGQNGGNARGIVNESTGSVIVTGSVQGGTGGNAHGILNNNLGSVTVNGAVSSSGTSASGIYNNANGSVTVNGQITAANGVPGIESVGRSATIIVTGPFITSGNGTNPVCAVGWLWANNNVTPTYYQIRTANLATIRPLYTADSVGGNPAASNVRSGTVYGPAGELTGTCAVPPAGSVALGVPVDATTGTAALTAADIRSAVGLSSANLDTQFSSIPANVRTNLSTELARIDTTVSSRLASASYTTPPTSGQNAQAVRTELATELGRIDVATSTRSTFNSATDTVANVTLVATTTNLTNPPDVPTTSEIADAVRIELTPELDRIDTTVSSRSTFNPATDTVSQVALVDTTTNLTNPPVVPTPEQIAAEVRVELTPELDRIDVDVSSRLATTEYVEPPTSEQNAMAVRAELTPELERVANCATVATTGEQIQDAWARSPNVP